MIDRESWAEEQLENLEGNTLDYLVSDENMAANFLCFLDEREKEAVQRGLNQWLKTREGGSWFDETLQRILENPPVDDEGRD